MSILKYISVFLILFILVTACSADTTGIEETNPVEDLFKIEEFSTADYAIEMYSTSPELVVGYNEISLRIKDLSNGKYLSDARLEWFPLMHMENKQHSAPHSDLSREEEGSLYTGDIVFQMPGNASEYWDIQLTIHAHGNEVTTFRKLNVMPSNDGRKKTQVFVGNDGNKYILAYVKPQLPKIGVQDFHAVLYQMESMMSFPAVENFVVEVDPRMPGMDNHSSPHNENLLYNSFSERYEGKLSLTMTGYWKINLLLKNEVGEIIKGEEITDSNPGSDLYFEVEF